MDGGGASAGGNTSNPCIGALPLCSVQSRRRPVVGGLDDATPQTKSNIPEGGATHPSEGYAAHVSASTDPVLVALVDDYDVVVIGVANMLEPYRDRVVVAELDTNHAVEDDVDVALYDTFAQPESDQAEVKALVDNPHAERVAVYTWNFHEDLIREARRLGASGYLSKALTPRPGRRARGGARR